eukprot:TRINITY_DN58542_c0_g1_i1.p1 TRINITY_DN58542_c0_g1~~TRINITY_DN58542_c0_g1_i1.p1  ORF type:complete len:232 (+),score=10.92 TRINITY_DN58542_c0_g1_i1:69-764(+)
MAATSVYDTPKDFSGTNVKTRRCRFFGMGICTRGSECRFAHATKEVRPQLSAKMCPLFLNTGSCTDEKCDYAHRREDVKKKRKHRRRKKRPPSQCSTSPPSTSPSLSEDTPPPSLRYRRTSQTGGGIQAGTRSRDGSMFNMQATNENEHDWTFARSAKDVCPETFVQGGFLVSVKSTFIHVELADTLSPVGMTRVSTAPGSIGDETIRKGMDGPQRPPAERIFPMRPPSRV